ncbi:MAG: UDP-N-acetylglucosamine--N-acetylmuramyl-(pentapeptide) pyrophosphoryl-undecaprenol N-acetylglucosamine transferase [Candidatus Gracilibacteria bacterium]|nr:UDP-N-acetylglucosamine--N-acetylmuramyl-(pentapeptide) pyrophosphoryl-undecaprenol N-acetylglucosamine transferase [Candidatus Gracilibacteria bacterium]
MEKKETIALTGGGTGGHIFPLASVYNYFQEEKEYNFIWVGEEGSLEEDIAGEHNIPFYDVPAGKIRRYFDWKNFYEPLKNLTGICFGIYYILRYKVDIVFSKGGYVSLPLCVAAFLLGKKIYIHESDTKGGMANRLIGKIASKVFYSFENKKTLLQENQNSAKHICVGQILNPELLDYLTTLDVKENEKLELLLIAGSQGSTILFKNFIKLLPDLLDLNITVVLGDKNLHFKSDFDQYKNVTVYDFVDQKMLGKIYKKTDIAITRAGSTTLWELNRFGVHSIIVPLQKSAANHQQKNAEYFEQYFGSNILDEDVNLSLEMFRLLQKFKDLRKQGLNLNSFFEPLHRIAKEIKK